MRKLGLRTEASVARIELADDRRRNFVNQCQSTDRCRAGKALVVLDGGHHAAGGLQRLVAPLAPNLRHGHQHAPDARPSVAIVARNIGAAKVRPSVGRKKCRQRPAALPADGRHRRLVARIHIGPLVAIHFHGNKKLIDQRRDLWIFVRFADPSRGTSGTTPRRCRAGWVCLQPARAQTQPRPTHASARADAAPSADTTTLRVPVDCRRPW